MADNGFDNGVARGRIEIDVARLQRQGELVIRVARQTGREWEQSYQRSSGAQRLFINGLKRTQLALTSIRADLQKTAALGAAFSGFGLNAADNLRTLNIQYRELAGSQEEAVRLQQEIAEAAQAAGLPVRQTQRDFLGLIPAIRETGDSFDTYLNLVSRLALVNPLEGTSGAVFAVREALASGGTDLVSLAERFNISRIALRELIEETGSFSEALDILLDKQGATTEAAEAQATSLRAARIRFQDAATRGLERAFTPQLERAADALNNVTDLLDRAPDGLVELGGSAAIAVTGLTAGALALERILSALIAIGGQDSALRTALSNPTVQRAGVGIGAVAVGTGAGIGITRAIGRATGDERLANQTLNDVLETGRQAIFIVLNQAIELIRQIVLLFNRILQGLLSIPDFFQSARGRLEEAFGGLIAAIGNAIATLPGAGESGAGIAIAGEQLRSQGVIRRLEAQQSITQRSFNGTSAINQTFDDAQRGLARAFGLIPSAAEEAADDTERASVDLQDALDFIRRPIDAIRDAAERARSARVEEIVQGFDERLRFEQELLQLQREADPDAIAGRIQSLEEERQAIQSLLPELQAVADESEEAAQSAAEYSQRLQTIDQQTERLGEALIAATNQALDTLGSDFQRRVREIEQERAQAVAEVMAQTRSDINELNADVAERRSELRDEEIEALEEFQEREAEIVEEHRANILEIERRGREAIIDAAGRLDAAGVAQARRRRAQELEEARERRDEEREENAERLDEQRELLSEEAQQISQYYQERLARINQAQARELQQLNQRFNTELQQEQSAYNQRRQILQQQLNDLVNAQNQERSLKRTGQATLLQDVRSFVSALIQAGNQLKSSSVSSSIPQQVIDPITQQPSDFSGVVPFHTGGRIIGSGLAKVEDKERVLTPRQNELFEQLVNGMSGGGLTPDRVAVDVSGAESFEEMVAMTARQVIAQVFQRKIAGVQQ